MNVMLEVSQHNLRMLIEGQEALKKEAEERFTKAEAAYLERGISEPAKAVRRKSLDAVYRRIEEIQAMIAFLENSVVPLRED